MIFLSLFLVLTSSYFLTALFNKNNKNNVGFIYFLLIVFAQVVLSFEVLSLFKSISEVPFIVCNMIFLILAVFLWAKQKFILYKPNIVMEFKNILKALKRDKILGFLSICFVIFIISELLMVELHPVIFGDALSYYFPRITAWFQNGTINHFITPDTRELIMPVNMEFLYAWRLLFTKSEYGLAIFPYIGFLGLLYVVYNFLGEFGFCRRKRLWSIFVVSSFIVFAVMAYTPSADLFIGALILASIYLLYLYIKYDNKNLLYFSTLSMALAIGTKTTAIIVFPSVFILISIMLLLFKKESFKKTIGFYLLFLFINFIIFSSYNYILNMIEFSNPVSCQEQFLLNKFRGGFKGYICNLIKYIFMFFDASAVNNIDFYNKFITKIQNTTYALIGENYESYMSPYFKEHFYFNVDYTIAKCALGVMGVLAFIPSFFISLIKGLRKTSSAKMKFMACLSLSLVFNILLFSRVMIFTRFNFRYLVTFIAICVPIVVFSYIRNNKNLIKWVLTYFMFVYLFWVSHKTPVALLSYYHKFMTTHPSMKSFKDCIEIAGEESVIYSYVKDLPKGKILLMSNKHSEAIYHILKLRLDGFELDRLLIEDVENYDLSKYDYIISANSYMSSSYVLNKKTPYCVYLDYKHEYVKDDKTPSAMSQCLIPFELFYMYGFKKVEGLKLNDYVVLKK